MRGDIYKTQLELYSLGSRAEQALEHEDWVNLEFPKGKKSVELTDELRALFENFYQLTPETLAGEPPQALRIHKQISYQFRSLGSKLLLESPFLNIMDDGICILSCILEGEIEVTYTGMRLHTPIEVGHSGLEIPGPYLHGYIDTRDMGYNLGIEEDLHEFVSPYSEVNVSSLFSPYKFN